MTSPSQQPPTEELPQMPKVYLLPNLMTAGNLFCGFAATIEIIAGTSLPLGSELWIARYENCLKYILFAFIFDMLDGRLARIGGRESSFGREFDSLADVVSFGIAPALLVLKILLADLPEGWHWVGGLVAFVYLLAGAMRLARFNIVSSMPEATKFRDFVGFPIPAAAGLVASITLFILTLYKNEINVGQWRYLLPMMLAILLVFLSIMMYSRIVYPSFKAIDWRSRRSIPQVLVTFVLLAIIVGTFRYSLAVVFLAYLVYGFVRPFISKRLRKEIEEDEEEDSFHA